MAIRSEAHENSGSDFEELSIAPSDGIDRADVLDKERRKMLTNSLLSSRLGQAIVLATSEEAPPLVMTQGETFSGTGRADETGRSSCIYGRPF